MKTVHFINLTNGIEKIPDLVEYSFIRIQSTACEQKRWDFILQDLDHNLLMNLAMGNKCIIYDFSKKGRSRALWQGVEWIKFILNIVWFGIEPKAIVKKRNVTDYFHEQREAVSRSTIKKLKYYRKFLLTNELKCVIVGNITEHDGDYPYYTDLIKE